MEDRAGARGADKDHDDDRPEDEEVDLERQIAQELASIQKPRKEQRFGTSLVRLFAPHRSHADERPANCLTNTPCGQWCYKMLLNTMTS